MEQDALNQTKYLSTSLHGAKWEGRPEKSDDNRVNYRELFVTLLCLLLQIPSATLCSCSSFPSQQAGACFGAQDLSSVPAFARCQDRLLISLLFLATIIKSKLFITAFVKMPPSLYPLIPTLTYYVLKSSPRIGLRLRGWSLYHLPRL